MTCLAPQLRMAVLSDRDILALHEAQALNIDPFSHRSLTPNGYDLRVAEILLPDQSDRVHRDGDLLVPPGARFLASTVEHVRLPRDVCASLWLRSSFARKGVFGSFGKVEAGFDGTLTLSCLNASSQPAEITLGERFCQLVLERLETTPEALYAQRSGKYQRQSGVTLARGP